MRTIDPKAMQRMEQSFMQKSGYPSLLLMEQAAQRLYQHSLSYITAGKKCIVLCGTGNNGGDAYALARLLLRDGIACALYAAGEPGTEDARCMRRLVVNLYGQEILPLERLCLADACLVVDGLFGTGFHGAVKGDLARVIARVNQSKIPVLAIDVPSGLDARTGYVENVSLIAQETISFHRPKQGLFLSQAPLYTGKVSVADIGIPAAFDVELGIELIDHTAAKALLPRLSPIAHKGDMGRVLILAGSVNMAGAACLVAKGARAAGGGLVTLASPAQCVALVQQAEPTVMGFVLEKEAQGQALLTRVPEQDCLVMGSGLDTDSRTKDLVRLCIEAAKQAKIPCVLDAEALNLLAEQPQRLPEHFVLTPHPGEAARLLRCGIQDVLRDYVAAAEQLHAQYGGVIVLKGARMLLYDGRQYALNSSGSPVLAKGGSGDVLSGILAALLAKSFLDTDLLHKAALGCYLLGRAGELAAQRKGEYAGTALDALDLLSLAL